MSTRKIQFTEQGYIPAEVSAETSLSETLNIENSPILFGCRTGICGTCLVSIARGSAAPPLPDEEEVLETIAPEGKPCRLACQLEGFSDLTLEVVDES